ncbi:MAG: urate hydroxylase PuuD [Myxococcota bacterium]
MSLALLSQEGLLFSLRFIHFLAGVMWIGLLYYFNFVQVPFFAETEAPVRTGAIMKLVPRALWWFRWGAMFTFLSGLTIIVLRVVFGGGAVMGTSWGVSISLGALIGIVMFLNVWLVIWPAQQIVIASTTTVAGGGAADPRAADAGARAFVASRTNTLFSIPMLFFMGAAGHLTMFGKAAMSAGVPLGIATLLVAAIEANVLFGKKGVGFSKVLEKPSSVVHVGLWLAVVLYLVVDLTL